jgi:hypothetical protein
MAKEINLFNEVHIDYVGDPVDANYKWIDHITTQMLENNLGYLDALRRSIEVANMKYCDDVRAQQDSMGTAVLAGVEDDISYDALVKLIETMRNGIALRRVAALASQQ